jgi:hypothetical protein
MTLSADQLTAIKHGESVRVREDGLDCIVLRADVYEQSCANLYDDSEWSEEEMAQLAERMFDDLDSAGRVP